MQKKLNALRDWLVDKLGGYAHKEWVERERLHDFKQHELRKSRDSYRESLFILRTEIREHARKLSAI